MRVTQDYSIQSLLNQVQKTRNRIYTHQRDLSTGKRVNQISDDPANIESILRFKTMLDTNARYEENINNASEFLTFASNSLNESADILATLKELAIQGVDSTGSEEFAAVAGQVTELLEELVDVANTTFKGRHIFAGTNTGTQPFVLAADYSTVTANPDGIDEDLQAEIGRGNVETYNITGQEAFLQNTDVFQTIIDLRDAFLSEDSAAISAQMDQLDASLDQVLQVNTQAGGRLNRFESLLDQLNLEDVKLESFRSNLEDTDIAETVVALQSEQTALESALRALGQTVNISLANFI